MRLAYHNNWSSRNPPDFEALDAGNTQPVNSRAEMMIIRDMTDRVVLFVRAIRTLGASEESHSRRPRVAGFA
jgi:hypothetical protein